MADPLSTLEPEYSKFTDAFKSEKYTEASKYLVPLKTKLLLVDALLPSSHVAKPLLLAARDIFEAGALTSIHLEDGASFSRFYHQLQPFYDAPASLGLGQSGNKNKLIGLQLLLLLSQNNIAEFHTMLETLEEGGETEKDVFVKYPVMLERWLMEGSYDKVWEATRLNQVPSTEYGLFSTVLVGTIRSEIASCSERAYTSIPISNAKNLLFLESEGAVIEFARERGWLVKDGRIWFPSEEGDKEVLNSESIIENTLNYARELETIV